MFNSLLKARLLRWLGIKSGERRRLKLLHTSLAFSQSRLNFVMIFFKNRNSDLINKFLASILYKLNG